MLSCFSHVQLFATHWTAAVQAPLSMGFSRQEYWSGWLCCASGYLPDPEIEPTCLLSPALAGSFFTSSATWEAPYLRQSQLIISLLIQTKGKTKLASLVIRTAWSLHP